MNLSKLVIESLTIGLKIASEIVCLVLLLIIFSVTFSRAVEKNNDRTMLRNATLLITMDPKLGEGALGIIEEGDVLFDTDKIIAVGKDLKDSEAMVLDMTGKIVLPGFVDVHNHLWQSVIRGCGSNKNLLGWLNECVFSMRDSVISESDVHALVRLSTLDLIGTGVTTVVDWSHAFTPEFVRGNIRGLSDSGLRFVYAYYGSQKTVKAMRRIKKELIDPNPLASFQIASHPTMAMISDLTAMARLARDLNVALNVHLLENMEQRQENPVEALQQAGAISGKLLVNHAIHLTDEEIKTLAKNDVRIAHNPLSNMRLASGIIRFPALNAAGVKVGLGLDGGTNDTSDMFANMRAALGLQRAATMQTKVFPTVEDVLRMATIDGAEVLDMVNKIGSITPGKKADLIILNPSTINFAPKWDWISQIVFNGQPSNVEYVFVNGRSLKAEGQLVGVSQTAVVQAAEDAARRIKENIQK